MCTAVTYINGIPAQCPQESTLDGAMGLCYYHDKMYHKLLEPMIEDVLVKTEQGVVIWSATSRRRSRK